MSKILNKGLNSTKNNEYFNREKEYFRQKQQQQQKSYLQRREWQ